MSGHHRVTWQEKIKHSTPTNKQTKQKKDKSTKETKISSKPNILTYHNGNRAQHHEQKLWNQRRGPQHGSSETINEP